MRTIGLALSLILIFMIPWEGVIQYPAMGTAARVMGLALAAFWLATVVITAQFRKPGPFHVIVWLFVLWNTVSVFWSADPDATLDRVVTWVQLLGMVLILWDLYTTRRAVLAGLQAYVLGAYVAVASAVFNYFSGTPFYTPYQRFSPDEMNPDGFGFIVVLGIPVAFYLAASANTTRMSGLLKLVNYAYIPAAFVGLALSGTRTAMIAAVPGMAFGLAALTRLRLSARVAVLVFLTSAAFLLLPYVQPLRSFQRLGTTYVEFTEGDLNRRTDIWREGLASFGEHPIIGVGSNMYPSVNRLGKVAHNSFLSVLVELGLIGFALFGIILTIALVQALSQPKWDARFWLAVLMAWAIGAFALTWEHRKTTWLFLSLVIASAALTPRRDEGPAFVRSNQPGTQVIPGT